MSKGKAIVELFRKQGMVSHETAGEWDFLYSHSTVRDEKHNLGDRVVTPDGRVFRYAKASNTLQPDYGCAFANGEFIEWSSIAAAQAAGDKEVTITVSASAGGEDADGVFDKDELRGGYIAIFKSGQADSIQRCIIGNTAKIAAGTSITIYLDAALERAVVTDDAAEVLGNPYAKVKDIHEANDAHVSIAGMPNSIATVGEYCWIQTWGPRWISPTGNATGGAIYERDVYFDSNGAISEFTYGSDLYDRQRAGFVIDKTTLGTDSSPFIMLQVSS